MNVRVLHSVTEVDASAWNAIVSADRLICTHEYLKAIENSVINDCRYFYPVVYDGGEIVAHTCLYHISTELDCFAQGPIKSLVNWVRKWNSGFMMLRSIECGTPVSLGNTISMRQGVDKGKIMDLIVSATEDVANELGVGVVVFRDFYDHELPFYDRLFAQGYQRVYNLPAAELEIKWKTFDEYLDSLRRVYRRRIRKQIAAMDCPEITVEYVQDFSSYSRDLERLWDNVFARAREYKREYLKRDFFENLDRGLGERSAVLLIKRSGVPVAFSLLLFDDETLTPLFCGLDYEHNAQYALYFNTLCKVVEIAIERRMKHIDMGITTLFPKRGLGADVVTLNIYMKHLNPWLNKIIPRAFRMMTPKPDLADMRVFKEEVNVA